jgi:transcriptional regulator with XRE-family HTH domain
MKTRGIKAITLAQRMGVNCAYVSQLLTGVRRPGRETLLKLSRSLEVPLDVLLMMESDTHDLSGKILISRKVSVLDEQKLTEWNDLSDLDYPAIVASQFEYATTDDPHAFYITAKNLASTCGLGSCDLILVEPGRKVLSGDTVFVKLPQQGISVRRHIVKEEIIFFVDDREEPVIFPKQSAKELKYYRISQCIRKL